MPTAGQIKNQNKALDEQQDIMSSLASSAADFEKSAGSASKYFGGIADKLKESSESAEDTKEEIKGARDYAKQFAKNLVQAVKSGIQKLTALTSKLKGVFSEIQGTVTNSMGEIGGIVQNILSFQIMAGFSALFTMLLNKFQATFKEVRQEIGSIFTQTANDLNKTFESMEANVLSAGLTFAELVQSTSELANNFGMAASEAATLSYNIADGAKAIGVQATTMSQVVGNFKLMGDLSTEQSHRLSEQIALLAAQNDVMPQAVMEDIASSTEEMAKFSKGGIKNFAKAAIQARKLGMSVKDISNTMSGLLNFEDSLNKELQASVMLGKNINLNEARRLAFAGDTAGAMAAVVSELGDIDLQGLDPLTLQSVADAAGVSTAQLMKMSKGADALSGQDIGMDGVDAMDTSLINARETMTEMQKFLADTEVKLRGLAGTYGPQFFESFKKSADLLIDTIVPNMATMMGDAMTAAENFMTGFNDAPDKVAFLKTQLAELWTYLKLKGKDALNWIEKEFDIKFDVILANIKKKIKGLNPFSGMFSTAGNIGAGVLDFAVLVSNPAQAAFKLIPGFAKTAFKKIAGGENYKAVAGYWGKFKTSIKESGFAETVKKGFTKIKDSKSYIKVSGYFTTLGENIKKVNFATLTEKFKTFSGKAATFMKAVPGIGVVGKVAKKVPILGNIILAAEGAIAAFKAYDKEKGVFTNALNMTAAAVTGVADSFLSSLADVADWVLPGSPIRTGYEAIKGEFKEAFADPKGYITATGKDIKKFYTDAKKQAKTWSDKTKTYFSDAWTGVKDKASKAWKGAETTFDEVFGPEGNIAKTATEVSSYFGDVKTQVVEKFTGIKDDIVTKFGDIKTDITGKFTGITADISAKFEDLKPKIKTKFETAATWVGTQKDAMVSAFKDVSTDIGDKFDNTKTWVKGKFKAGLDYAGELPTKFADKFSSMKQSITDKAGDIGGGISDAFKGAGKFMDGLFDGTDFEPVWKKVKDGGKAAADFIKKAFMYPFDAIADMFNSFIDGISNMEFMPHFGFTNPITKTKYGFGPYHTPDLSEWKMNVPSATAQSPAVAQDFLSRPGQETQRFSPSDNIIGYKGSLVDLKPLVETSKHSSERNSQENNQIMQLLTRQNTLLEAIINNGLAVRKA